MDSVDQDTVSQEVIHREVEVDLRVEVAVNGEGYRQEAGLEAGIDDDIQAAR